VPQASDLERVPALPGEAADRLGAPTLPQSDGLGDLTAENSLAVDEMLRNPLSSLGGETAPAMNGHGDREEPLTVPQSSQESPGPVGTATAATDGLTPEGVETFSLSGPAADTDVRLTDGELDPALEAVEPVTGQVGQTLPQSSELGLPQ